jgi:hypothetical protein
VSLAEVASAETGWTTSMTCDGGSPGQAAVTIDLGAGKSVTCTVTNTYRAPSKTTPESSTTMPGVNSRLLTQAATAGSGVRLVFAG